MIKKSFLLTTLLAISISAAQAQTIIPQIGTLGRQNANAVAITGGTISGVAITTSTFSGTSVTTPILNSTTGPQSYQVAGVTEATLNTVSSFYRYTIGNVGGSAPGKLRIEAVAAGSGYEVYRDGGTGFLKFDGEQTPFTGYLFSVNGGSTVATITSTGLNSTAIGATTPAAISGTTLTASGILTLTGIPTTCSGAPTKSIAAIATVLTQCP